MCNVGLYFTSVTYCQDALPVDKRLDADVYNTCKHFANNSLAFMCAKARLIC